MSGKEIRKIVCLLLSCILLVTSFILFPWRDDLAGMGNGSNARLSSIEDLSVLLRDFSSELSSYDKSRYEGDAVNTLSYLAAEEQGEGEQTSETHQKVHTSVTMVEVSSAHLDMDVGNSIFVSSDSPYKDMMSSSSTRTQETIDLERTLRVYITPDAVLYDSDFVLSTSTTINSDTSKINISVRIMIYIGTAGVMMRFERFEVIQDQQAEVNLDAVLGKWIDFSPLISEGMNIDMLLGIEELNGNNFDVLSYLGETIEKRLDGGFIQTGNHYRLKEELFGDFCSTLLQKQGIKSNFFEDSYEGNFDIDFFDKEAPHMALTIKNEAKNYSKVAEPYKGVKTHNNAKIFYAECDEFIFKYIDNTVVNTPEDAIGPEELESLIEGNYGRRN